MKWLSFLLMALVAQADVVPVEDVQHQTVYYEKGRFGGWPANHGIWIWGNEILVGFSKGFYKDLGPDRHHIDREAPELHFLARSMDGGESWKITDPGLNGDLIPEGGFLHGVERKDVPIPSLKESPGGIRFTHPDFAMTLRTDNIDAGTGRFWYSYDRGHDWEGPFRLPHFGFPGTAFRTDYIVEGNQRCTAFTTVAKADGNEGQCVCIRTVDGGETWIRVGNIGPEPTGFTIMPSSVKLDEDSYYVAVRNREEDRRWIGAYRSDDQGKTWKAMPDPVEDCGEGNPPSLIRLKDGRLCLTYGHRAEPFSIRARLSEDQGRTWGPVLVLRDDGENRDIGYCRSVQRPDGKVVTLYYITDPKNGPERSIVSTIWMPPMP